MSDFLPNVYFFDRSDLVNDITTGDGTKHRQCSISSVSHRKMQLKMKEM